MSQTGILGAFQSHAFLANLSQQHLLILASGARPFSAKPGQYLAKEGEAANCFYLIQSGQVEIDIKRTGRTAIPIQNIGPGEVLGWSWMIPGHRWHFDCRAVDDVKGISFDAHWLRERCEQDHELGYHLLRQLMTVIASRLEATRTQLSNA